MPHPSYTAATYICLGLLVLSGCGGSSKKASAVGPPLAPPPYEKMSPDAAKAVRDAWDEATKQPLDVATNGKLALMLMAYDQPAAAVPVLDHCILLHPESFHWYYYKGQALAASGNPIAALDAFKVAVQLKPGFLPLQLKIADAFLAAGRLNEAERAGRAIVLQYADCAPAHQLLATVYGKAGRNVESAAESVEAAKPPNPYLLTQEAMKDPWMQAIENFKSGHDQARKDPRPEHFKKGRELFEKKQYKQAIEELKQTTVGPEDGDTPGYLLSLSIAYSAIHDNQNALETVDHAQELAMRQRKLELLAAIEDQLTKVERAIEDQEEEKEAKKKAAEEKSQK